MYELGVKSRLEKVSIGVESAVLIDSSRLLQKLSFTDELELKEEA
jgi:hypothetical protein